MAIVKNVAHGFQDVLRIATNDCENDAYTFVVKKNSNVSSVPSTSGNFQRVKVTQNWMTTNLQLSKTSTVWGVKP